MLMPKLMNGFEKSMTRSRTDVMVNGAMARSASWNDEHVKLVCNLILPLDISKQWYHMLVLHREIDYIVRLS